MFRRVQYLRFTYLFQRHSPFIKNCGCVSMERGRGHSSVSNTTNNKKRKVELNISIHQVTNRNTYSDIFIDMEDS